MNARPNREHNSQPQLDPFECDTAAVCHCTVRIKDYQQVSFLGLLHHVDQLQAHIRLG